MDSDDPTDLADIVLHEHPLLLTRACALAVWLRFRRYLCAQFATLLKPMDDMLAASPFLLTDRPLFVDYNLYGVLGNYLFNGKTKLPNLKHLRRWYQAMNTKKATLVTPFPSMCLLTQIAGGLAGRANRVWLVADGRTKGLNYERECLRKNSAMAGLFIFPLATASTMSTSA